MPAYEDPAYYALVEQKLPIDVTPGENKLDDPVERARIVRMFEQGLDTPVSYVLPVQVWHSPDLGRRWVTERWGIRRGKLFLVPGDSPLGPASARVLAGDLAGRSTIRTCCRAIPSPMRAAAGAQRAGASSGTRIALKPPPVPPPTGPSELYGSVRTALAIEPRDGHLVRLPAAARPTRSTSPRSLPRSRKRPPARRSFPSTSRAIRRRPIRASTSSR